MATKTTTFVVRQHRPWKALFAGVFLIAAFVGSSYWLFQHAQERAGFDRQKAALQRDKLEDRIDLLDAENEKLRARIAVLERAGQIDRESHIKVRDQVKELQDENLELKQELAFYRGIVSPDDRKAGLKIQSFQLSRGQALGEFRYKLILTQVLKNDKVAQGNVALAIGGMLNGRPEQLPLSRLAQDGDGKLHFKFKFFQNFEGDIQLPEGFRPESVHLVVTPSGKGLDKLEQRLDWQIAES